MSKVIILPVQDSAESISQHIQRIMDEFNICGKISPDSTVVLKPNLTALLENEQARSTLTDFRILKALVERLHLKCRLFIYENSARGIDTRKVFARYGYNDLAGSYKVKLVAGDDVKDAVKVKVNQPLVHKFIFVNKLVTQADVLINLPVMKTHVITKVSLGMKNLKGCLPDTENARFHLTDLNKSIVDLNKVIKPALTIMDAIYAQEGDGPIAGQEKRLNYLLASDDHITLDYFSVKMMGLEPEEVEHIALAIKTHNINPEEAQLIGELPVFKFERPTLSALDLKMPEQLSRHSRFDLKPLAAFIKYLEAYRFYFLTKALRVLLKPLHRFCRDRYWIDNIRCNQCQNCIKVCPLKAIRMEGKRFIIKENCQLCNICIEFCPRGAINSFFC